MAYIGNIPAESFASFEKQVFTIVNSQTAYTLSHSVTNENDIRLVVNSVVQEPGSGKAYTASGTTLTLSAALTNGTDTMYCVFLGRALQTVNAPNASVGSDQTAPTIITGQTAETSIATDDTILIHDTSASALRKMTRANFVSGIGGTNTPAFQATISGSQNLTDETATKVQFNSETFDSGSVYDASSNFRFTPGVAGKYYIYATLSITGSADAIESIQTMIYKNGSSVINTLNIFGTHDHSEMSQFVYGIDIADADDYYEIYGNVNVSSGNAAVSSARSFFGAYKIIE